MSDIEIIDGVVNGTQVRCLGGSVIVTTADEARVAVPLKAGKLAKVTFHVNFNTVLANVDVNLRINFATVATVTVPATAVGPFTLPQPPGGFVIADGDVVDFQVKADLDPNPANMIRLTALGVYRPDVYP